MDEQNKPHQSTVRDVIGHQTSPHPLLLPPDELIDGESCGSSSINQRLGWQIVSGTIILPSSDNVVVCNFRLSETAASPQPCLQQVTHTHSGSCPLGRNAIFSFYTKLMLGQRVVPLWGNLMLWWINLCHFLFAVLTTLSLLLLPLLGNWFYQCLTGLSPLGLLDHWLWHIKNEQFRHNIV